MSDDVKINIENATVVPWSMDTVLATTCASSMFAAYRASGKEREEALRLALSDYRWFMANLPLPKPSSGEKPPHGPDHK